MSQRAPRANVVAGSDEAATVDADYAEIFVGVGRRDGAKAHDLQRVFVDVAGVDRDSIRRIRVRDRHAFVAIRKADAAGAVDKLNGQTIAGKSATVELARDRSASATESTGATEDAAEGNV